jgi:malonyl-CoA/methylmalonyl-CoA synthetase
VGSLTYPDIWGAHVPDGGGLDPASLTEQRSLPAVWARRWRDAPDSPAVGAAGRWLTSQELDEASARVAGRLHGAGLRSGDRILFSAGSSIDLVISHVAALRLGLVVVPFNTAYTAREVAHIAADAEPTAAVVDDRVRGEWIGAVVPLAVIVTPRVELAESSPPELDSAGRDDAALLAYTSGTTGAPKGALLSHGNLIASAQAVAWAWRWTAADRLLLCLPLFHAHGLCVGLHGTLLVGASAVLMPGFAIDPVFDAIRDSSCTLFFGVPTMYHRLADTARAPELAELRLCVSGSAPLAGSVHRRLEDVTGQRVLERYGMTETLMNTSNPYVGERRPGTVGLPLPGCEVRLAADGEIQVRGPNVFSGYWRNAAATDESFTDGWFRTGDIGELDDDGYLQIVGRSKELIISGGFNVYPREIEDALLDHPAVLEVAVVGTPSAEWGEVVTAVIVPRGDPPMEQDLGDWAADRLAGYKRPRIWRFVDHLPRNAVGKVLRKGLV